MAWTDVLKDGAPYGAYVAWCRNDDATLKKRVQTFDGTAGLAAECFETLRDLVENRLSVGHKLTSEDMKDFHNILDGTI